MVLVLIDILQVYRNPGRVAPYTNYSGESIDLDLFEDDQLGHPGGHMMMVVTLRMMMTMVVTMKMMMMKAMTKTLVIQTI